VRASREKVQDRKRPKVRLGGASSLRTHNEGVDTERGIRRQGGHPEKSKKESTVSRQLVVVSV
jgi:hypothetical protein